MSQCDLCYAQDEDITKEMLKNECIDDTDDYFLSYNELTVCKDCYYKRDEWDKESDLGLDMALDYKINKWGF